MTNFYEELELSQELSTDALREKIQEIYSVALRRLNSTVGDADREYNVRKTLEKIEEALAVFENDEKRQSYDERLMQARDRSGYLMHEKIQAYPTGEMGHPKTEKNPKERILTEEERHQEEENKKLQEIMLKKSIAEAIKEQQAQQTAPVEVSIQKASNYVTRAQQSLEDGKLKDAFDFIEKALDEEATYGPAWETLFYYHVVKQISEDGHRYHGGPFQFPLFGDDEIPESSAEISAFSEHLAMEAKYKALNDLSNASLKKDLKQLEKMKSILSEINQWLDSDGIKRRVYAVAEYYQQELMTGGSEYLAQNAYIRKDAWSAKKKMEEYFLPHEKTEMHQRVFEKLKQIWMDKLTQNTDQALRMAEEKKEQRRVRLRYFTPALEKSLQEAKRSKSLVQPMVGVILFMIALLFQAIKLNYYGLELAYTLVQFYDQVLFFNLGVVKIIYQAIGSGGILTFHGSTLLIMLLGFKGITAMRIPYLGYIQWGTVLLTLAYAIYGAAWQTAWSMGFFNTIFLTVLYVYLLKNWVKLFKMAAWDDPVHISGKSVTYLEKIFGFKR